MAIERDQTAAFAVRDGQSCLCPFGSVDAIAGEGRGFTSNPLKAVYCMTRSN